MTVVLMAILLAVVSTEAATDEEKAALKQVAEELGIPGSLWNFSTDPCYSQWPGVGCCADKSEYCCKDASSIYYNPPIDTSRCDFTTDARVTVLLLHRELLGIFLNGTLRTSSSLCKLSSLLCLDVENNNLNGAFPTCFHTLTSLQVLRMGGNSINGSIPPELGSLQALQHLHLESLYLTGTIPVSLGNMTRATRIKLEYNQLEGSIPMELKNIPKLQYLGLQGNRLTGGIPPFGNELIELILSGNSLSGQVNGSSLNGMVACTDLALRGNALNGSIPDIRLPLLKTLDLSFNRFSGGIPKFQTNTLQTLLLSHNDLTGELGQLPSSVQAVDISHNQLKVDGVKFNEQDNYAFNNNTENTFNDGKADNLYFAVNAGGNKALIHGNLTFDSDTDTPGRSNSNSSVGLFRSQGSSWALELSGTSAGTYTVDTVIENTNQDTQLYQSMRWCSSYMAYHGVGLQPGPYTITLRFVELVFDEPEHRVFDVFVGGRMVKQGLDIVKETGGPRRAHKLAYNANVLSNGTLSVELVYRSGKGGMTDGGPAISAISVVSPLYRYTGHSKKNMVGPVAGGAVAAVLVIVCVCIWWWWRRRKRKATTPSELPLPPAPMGLYDYSLSSSGSFSYHELYQATNGFSEKLGSGGFGVVYKGRLSDGVEIAVKQLLVQSNVEDFKREIYILTKVRHKNLVSILGHCFETGLPMLVTEFMPNGTLERWLFENEECVLTWEQRMKIAIGVACGLEYLHQESKYKILHLDIKPGNILLDAEMNPHITDFGLSKLYEKEDGNSKSEFSTTTVRGTMGYLAPEYAMASVLSDKVDVYAFGVVLLELISGRRSVDYRETSEKVLLVDWARKQLANKLIHEVVDERLGREFDKDQAKDMVSVSILCTHKKPALRPKMQKVWLMLNGHVKVSDVLATLMDESDTEVPFTPRPLTFSDLSLASTSIVEVR